MFSNKADELRSHASDWVSQTFNYISLDNAEKVFDNQMFEYIESKRSEDTANDFLHEYGYLNEFKDSSFKQMLLFIDDNYEDEYLEYIERDNYPMWNTLFEFRDEPSEKVLELAKNAGFGVVRGCEYYGAMLFVHGAGYSFMGAHWIPLYLSLPWVDSKKYDGVDYSHL